MNLDIRELDNLDLRVGDPDDVAGTYLGAFT